MKNFQIFLKDGHVRYAAADRVEVGISQVVLYAAERIVATYEKASVIMLDEFEMNGLSVSSEFKNGAYLNRSNAAAARANAGSDVAAGPPEAA